MKERPILFNAPMVRALLAGTKTQTRRVVKPQPEVQHDGEPYWFVGGYRAWQHRSTTDVLRRGGNPILCPYGQPGDRLWVREAHSIGPGPGVPLQPGETAGALRWPHITYSADGAVERRDTRWKGAFGMGRPSIHMPRWASRITLEIVSVRVERLKEISEADARAEGCERLDDGEPGYVERYKPDWKLCPQCGGTRLYTAIGAGLGALPDTDCLRCDTYAKRYRHLWESINGAGSWDANPWIWVGEFKPVAAKERTDGL
jgi:hypothetical protein